MNKKILNAEPREVKGRKVKKLRQQGLLPANIFGKKIASESVQISDKEFKVIYKEVGDTGLITLTVGKVEKPVLVHDVQVNPMTDEMIHVNFLQVDLKEKVEAEVPVELIGESPAEKQSLGTVVQYINEIRVEALPTDLPEKFEVDTSELAEVDQAIYIKDLKYDKSKVEVKNDQEEIVVKVEPPQKEEVVEVTPVVAVGAEGAVPAEGAVAEGDATDTSKEEGQK